MAKKKAKKGSTPARPLPPLEGDVQGPMSDEPVTPEMMEQFFGVLPPFLRKEVMEGLIGMVLKGQDEPPRKKPRSKAGRQVQELIAQARRQPTAEAAIPILTQAETIARQALGANLTKLAGSLGDSPAGETYLDVKMELAEAYSAAGQRAEAVAHIEEMLRLDEVAPERARILLLAGYFDLGRLDDAQRLLDKYGNEPIAAFQYGRLLLDLRRGVRGWPVDAQLTRAYEANGYVVSYLLGLQMPDPVAGSIVEMGEESEAEEYATDFLAAWKETPGAISWLREAISRLKLEIAPSEDDEPAAPVRLSAREYAELPPHRHPVWIAGLHEMPSIELLGEDRAAKCWLIFAFAPNQDVIGFDLVEHHPQPREFWERLTSFMLSDESPGRPQEIQLHPPGLMSRLTKAAARAKIKLAPFEDSEELEELLAQLGERMQGASQAADTLDPNEIRQAPLDVDAVWEAAVMHLENWITVASESIRPWVALVMSRASGAVLWHELFTKSPPPDALANAVRMAIARPSYATPHRPREVVVPDYDQAVSLRPVADEAGFVCTVAPELPLVADAVASLTREVMGGEPPVVLTKAQGVAPPDLEAFYTAAAEFFRARPWKQFAMDEVARLDWSSWPGQPHYALVMGQSGITQGLAVYKRLRDIRRMFAEQSDVVSCDSFSVMFGEELSIAPADLDAIEQFGWPVATPEAYPDALRVYPDQKIETPTAAELRFLAASLRAVTWLSQHRGQKTTTIDAAGEQLVVTRLGPVDAVRE